MNAVNKDHEVWNEFFSPYFKKEELRLILG
jgi:hypothetical protein